MNPKRAVTGVLLAFVAVSIAVLVAQELRPAPRAALVAPGAQAMPRKVVVYYFHPTKRCDNCRRIESVARKTLEREFPAEFQDGRLEWRVLNYEEPGNTHFVDDYQIAASTLVAVEFRHGTQGRWKNLDEMWDFIIVEEQLADFVRKELRAFVKEN